MTIRSLQSPFIMNCNMIVGLLRLIMVVSFFTYTQSYPTNYILSRNPHIKKDVVELASVLSNPLNPPYTYSPQALTNFKTTSSSKLKPLMCISKMNQYNFEQVNYVLAFSVKVKIIDDGSGDSTTDYTVEIDRLYQRQGIINFELQTIFFSKDLEYLLNQETPIFYSFYYSSDKLHPNKTDRLNEPINLPMLVGEAQFRLPSTYSNYLTLCYLTGVDLMSKPSDWVFGINTNILSVSNNRQLKIQIDFRQTSTQTTLGAGRWIRLLELSILLYNPTQLQQTQHFLKQKLPQPQIVTNATFTTQNFQNNTLDLSNGDFLFGLNGIVMGNSIRKVNFQLAANFSTDNKLINIDITLDQTLPVDIMQAYFLFTAWVQCPDGSLYERDMSQNSACIEGQCKVNYYISTEQNYGQNSCFECQTICIIQQGQLVPTCLDSDLQPHPCTPEPQCLNNETKVPQNFKSINNINQGSSDLCIECTFLFGTNCLTCTYQECTSCNQTFYFYIDDCILPEDNNSCYDHQEIDIVTGKCIDIVELKLMNWEKLQFSNKVIVHFKLSNEVWYALLTLNQIVDLHFSDTFADKISEVTTFYDYSTEKFSVQITYNSTWVQGLELTASLNFDPFTLETLKFTTPQTSTVKLQMNQMGQSYFLINHDPNVYSIAMIISILYKIAAFIGFGFLLVGYIGGKYIVLQVLAVLQITFLGLLQLQKYTPLQRAVNYLSTISGNFIFEPSPLNQMSQLNTLNLQGDFVGNFNIQIMLFTIFLLIGGSLMIYSKVKKSQKSVLGTLIGMTLLCEYSLYGLLVFSYLASASIGLQIKYQFIDKIGEPNYISLGLGIVYILVLIFYMVMFVMKKLYFGEFFKEMKTFSMNECFICFLTAEKFVIGFLLGILCNFKYIGFLLAGIQALFLAYVIIKQPFFYGFHTIRLVWDYGWIILVLIGYNLQKLYFEDYTYIDSNPWLYAWPLTTIVGIYLIFLKNAIAMGKQIRVCIFRIKTIKKIYEEFTKYCQQNQNPQQNDFEEAKKIILRNNLPEKIQLTDKQIQLWKKIQQVQRQQNQLTTSTQNQQPHQQQYLLRHSIKAKKQLKKLKDTIKKKLKAKISQEPYQLQQTNHQNHQEINNVSQYSSHGQKSIQQTQSKDQEFQSLLSKQKQRQKMTTIEHWMQIDQQFRRFQSLDEVKQTPEQLQQKYEGLQFVRGDKTMVKLANNKTLPIKNMKILQQNPILGYYRNEIDFELHAKVNPFEELKDELRQQKRKLQNLDSMQQKKMEEQERQRLKKQKQKEQIPKKKLMYRGGQKFGNLAKNLNDKNGSK